MISKKEVEHIARLARIELTEGEKTKFATQLAAILEFVEKLNEVNTKNIEPLTGGTTVENVTRADREPDKSLEGKPAELIAAAPDTKNGYIKVKSVF